MRAIVLIIVCLASANSMALPYTICGWDEDVIKVWINPTNLQSSGWYYETYDVIAQLKNAINAWNNSGANIALRYEGSDPNKNTAANDELLVIFKATPNPVCAPASTSLPPKQICIGGVIEIWMQIDDPLCPMNGIIDWRTTYVGPDVTRPVFDMAFVHEMGHAMGFMDNYSSPRSSVMNGWGGNANYLRYLWPNDKYAVRSDPEYGYGLKNDSFIVTKDSYNGSDWFAGPSPSAAALYTPGLVYGNGRYVLVYVDATNGNRVVSRIANAGAWGTSAYDTGIDTYDGPDIAYGDGKYVVVYSVTSGARYMQVRWSSNGTSWTGGPEYVAPDHARSSYIRPTISYNSYTNQFHVITTDIVSSRVCTYTASSSNMAYWAEECGDNDNETAISGVGAVCNTLNQCTYGWATSDTATNAGRNGKGISAGGILTLISLSAFSSTSNSHYSIAKGASGYLMIGRARASGFGIYSGSLFRMMKTAWDADWGSSQGLNIYTDYGADVAWDSTGAKYRMAFSN